MKIWMKVTLDRYEFPLEIADSALALAKKCGTTRCAVISGVSKYKLGKARSSFRKVVIDDTEDKEC